MVDILGFDAAAVDSHRREGAVLCRWVHTAWVGLEELRNERAQHFAM